jgi:uncharacterized protein (TIGR02594 family)
LEKTRLLILNSNDMKSLIKIAAGEIGIKEVAGEQHEKRILDYAKEAGFKNIKDDETPWCSIFVNWCCKEAGLQRTNRLNARSWLTVGLPVEDPAPGDIVVFWRESPNSWKGHVGVFFGFSKNRSRVFCLGGNQKNTVSVQGYDATTVLGFRRLTTEEMVGVPKARPNLKLGSAGEEVKKLQTVLGELGFDCGALDGIFGPRTERMLMAFQREEGQEADGIYGDQTKALIESIFQS